MDAEQQQPKEPTQAAKPTMLLGDLSLAQSAIMLALLIAALKPFCPKNVYPSGLHRSIPTWFTILQFAVCPNSVKSVVQSGHDILFRPKRTENASKHFLKLKLSIN